jgi:alkyldihydroxyacetonephosphate synthase
VDFPLPAVASDFLAKIVGPGSKPRDATLNEALSTVRASRLPDHELIIKDPLERLRHARGQSLPDWVALRSGRVAGFPDGVAYPLTDEDVRLLIRFAIENGVSLIPYGGGTSVVGHVNPQSGGLPVLTVSLQRLSRLRQFDETSQLATFGAGVQGPDLEAQLRARGFTLGHFPQSFELSTLGGWIATRSIGQQSLGFGRIEDLFAGGRLESPAGELELPPFPASAAGPDLRQLVLGSEGRLGIITEATVRITPLPEREDFHAVFFPDFDSGFTAVRQIIQAGIPLSMMRYSTAIETATTLALAGHERFISTLERLLTIRNVGDGKCMLLLGFTGSNVLVRTGRRAALNIAKEYGAVHVGRTFGHQWHKGRFRTPYLRNSLWDAGYAVDTVETATNWNNIQTTMAAMESAVVGSLADVNERVHVFSHLSHVYTQGASIYSTYLFRLAPDPNETLALWRSLKTAVSEAIVSCKGTISHQHGVGTDHSPYLEAEKGTLGMAALADLSRRFDPYRVMNPGKLIA